MTAACLPLSGLKQALRLNPSACPSLPMGDCLRLFRRVGGFFFHACQDRFQPFGKRLGGGCPRVSIVHFASLNRSSLNAIEHEAKSQWVPNSEHFIINRRVK